MKQHTLHELILFSARKTITSESHVFLLKTRKRKNCQATIIMEDVLIFKNFKVFIIIEFIYPFLFHDVVSIWIYDNELDAIHVYF